MRQRYLIIVILIGMVFYGMTLWLEYREGGGVVGRLIPDQTFEDASGNPVQLAQFRGKKILLHFWATWCPPCVNEIPSLNRVYKTLGEDWVLIAVSADDGPEAVSAFRKKIPFDFPVYFDADTSLANSLEVFGLPETAILDQNFKVVKKLIGPQDWDSLVINSHF